MNANMNNTVFNSLQSNPFKCGACHWITDDLQALHGHLIRHTEGGNFFFHLASRTGFPTEDTICSETQTDTPLCVANTTQTTDWQFSTLKSEVESHDKDVDGKYFPAFQREDQNDNYDENRPNGVNEIEDNQVASHTRKADVLIIKTEVCDIPSDDTDEYMDSLDSQAYFKIVSKKKNNKLIIRKSKKNDVQRKSKKLTGKGRIKQESVSKNKTADEMLTDRTNSSQELDENDPCKLGNGLYTDNDQDTKHSIKLKLRQSIKGKQSSAKKEKKVKKGEIKQENDISDSVPVIKKERKKHYANKLRIPRNKRCKVERKLEDKVTPCHLCLLQFGTRQGINKHVETDHDGQYVWKCDTCLIPFIDEEECLRHAALCKDSWVKSHACIECGNSRLFLSKNRLIEHLKSQHSGRFPLSCCICNKEIASQFDEHLHMAEHNPELLKCKFCNVVSKTVYYSEVHMMSHIREGNPNVCYICEKEFEISYSVQLHLFCHLDDEGSYMCELCGASFAENRRLEHHRALCGKNFKCEICGRCFARNCYLKEHIAAHAEDGRKNICDQCGAAFKARRSMHRHQRNVHNLKPSKIYECPLCHKTFLSKLTYTRHTFIHDNIQPYTCEDCGKKFRTKWNLEAHRRQHTGVKPYVCTQCGMAFTHNVVRKNHQTKCVNTIYTIKPEDLSIQSVLNDIKPLQNT